jgi:hypothetical protein
MVPFGKQQEILRAIFRRRSPEDLSGNSWEGREVYCTPCVSLTAEFQGKLPVLPRVAPRAEALKPAEEKKPAEPVKPAQASTIERSSFGP